MLEGDAEVFDCERCEYRQEVERLSPENARAWQAWRQISNRCVMDFGLAGDVVRRLTAGDDDETALDLFARLAVIYDVLMPPPAPQ